MKNTLYCGDNLDVLIPVMKTTELEPLVRLAGIGELSM